MDAAFSPRSLFTTRNHFSGQNTGNDSPHAKKLDVDYTGCTEKNVGDALRKLIAVNQVQEGRARVIMLARSGRDIWKTKAPGTKKTDLLIMTGDPQNVSQNGLSLAVSPYRAVVAARGNQEFELPRSRASWEEAQSRDFDEAVVLNERGEIVSATTANLFWAKEGTLHTPTLSTGALAGIARMRDRDREQTLHSAVGGDL